LAGYGAGDVAAEPGGREAGYIRHQRANRGEEGVRRFFEGISEAARKFELEVERLEPLGGDRVLARLTLHLETTGGYPQSQPIMNLYEIEDGRPSRVRVFFDRAEALVAAGLSEWLRRSALDEDRNEPQT
jgi:hypothetical protein